MQLFKTTLSEMEISKTDYYAQAEEAAAYIRERYQGPLPAYGIILGTGLGALVHEISHPQFILYENIPHFPVSTVESHAGRLIFGEIEGQPVMVMQGRFHYYEGYNMAQVTFPVRVMKMLGVQILLVSNAAGGLNPSHQMSDLMALTDHINLQPSNPLIGWNDERFGPRFPDMSDTYDAELLRLARQIAHQEGFRLQEGVYASVPGPNLETPAEYRYLHILGADAVGMSTVPEVLVARHMNMTVFAVSVITDLCAPGRIQKVSLEDVIRAANQAEPNMALLFRKLIAKSASMQL